MMTKPLPPDSLWQRLKHTRGYLLIEVTLAGAITSAAILGLLAQLGDARATSITDGRGVTAQGVLKREVERVRAAGFVGVTTQSPALVAGLNGQYKTARAIVGGNEALFGSATTAFKDVTVTVTHPDRAGVRTFATTVRVYE
jgi:hypothetical protein